MKKYFSILLVMALLLTCLSAVADTKIPPNKYSIPTEGRVVLQDSADRQITPAVAPVRHELIPGESPTTGYPWSGARYQPMIAQISNPSGTVNYNGKKITGAGLGVRSPWGAQYADIIYEGILYRTGATRLSFLFNDSFASGQPVSVGPIRSARIGHVLLQAEWEAGLAFGGGPRKEGNDIMLMLKENGAMDKGIVFNVVDTNDWNDYTIRVRGVKSPDNLDIDMLALQSHVPEAHVAQPRPFLFTDASPYVDGYELAYNLSLDWGDKKYISSFNYDEMENMYFRTSCGAPYMTYQSKDDREVDNQEQLAFSNVIIQRVHYDYVNNNKIMPDMKSIGQGNADIFIAGRYIPGYWVRTSETEPTVFLDDKGNELQLTRGKTFIAHFPPESRLTYSSDY